MSFDAADYRRGAQRLGAPVEHPMAVTAIESSGENFWTLGNRRVPAIRPEAHWFSKFTNRQYDASHPHISSRSWRPEIAAKSKAEAWRQYEEMAELDPVAAAKATSWGPFQIMGFHHETLGYPDVRAFVDAVDGPDDDGQMDTFIQFVKADPRLLRAIREGDWEEWETVYNGGGYGGAYASKIRAWLATNGGQGGDSIERGQLGPVVPRVLKKGDQGVDVSTLQTMLRVPVDGDFGPATDAAVRTFQASKGLVVDGVVGVMTLRALGLAA